MRRDAVARGQITEEGVQQARAEQDAYETGYNLAQLREHVGLPQTEVAERMDVTQPRVSALERGQLDQLTVATVRAYVVALGGGMRIVVSVDDATVDLGLPSSAA